MELVVICRGSEGSIVVWGTELGNSLLCASLHILPIPGFASIVRTSLPHINHAKACFREAGSSELQPSSKQMAPSRRTSCSRAPPSIRILTASMVWGGYTASPAILAAQGRKGYLPASHKELWFSASSRFSCVGWGA